MNWRNPNAEIHATGWPAVILVAGIALMAINGLLSIATRLF